MLRHLRLDQIDEEILRGLVKDGAAEDQHLEFVEQVGEGDAEKRSFLQEVAAFANTPGGGDVVVGVREERGIAVEINGVPTDNPEQTWNALHELCARCIEPLIIGLRIHRVDLGSGGVAFVLRIPQSIYRPHLAKYRKLSHLFHVRRGTAKDPVSVAELRMLFSLSASIEDRVRSFHQSRIDLVQARTTPIDLQPRDLSPLLFHIIPLSAFDLGVGYDLSKIDHKNVRTGGEPRYNLDGLISSFIGESGREYLQVFRNGILEYASAPTAEPCEIETEQVRAIFGESLEQLLLEILGRFIRIERELDVPPPFVVFLSILWVKGVVVLTDEQYRRGGRYIPSSGRETPIDRHHVTIPAVRVETLGEGIDPRASLRPIFDSIWQAGGRAGSPSY